MERHQPDGQFYNWYDHRDGAKLTTWPPTGDAVDPILSSVDNGWLATGLKIVRTAVPELSAQAGAIYDSMDFGFYYVPDKNRILFNYSPATRQRPVLLRHRRLREPDRRLHRHRQGRAAAQGVLRPLAVLPRHLRLTRARRPSPAGSPARYDGVSVYDGSYPYNDTRLTPSWGGSMFEALMPSLFVPEETWGAGSWRQNHPLTVDAQIDHGMNVAQLRHVGLLAVQHPRGRLRRLRRRRRSAWTPTACPSNEDSTLVDHGFAGCPGRDPAPDPPQSAYTNGVVTPHAAFLALRYRPQATIADLTRLEAIPDMYGKWGFRDSVNTTTSHVSDGYLSLDQGMAMAALGNALGNDVMRTSFATPDVQEGDPPGARRRGVQRLAARLHDHRHARATTS